MPPSTEAGVALVWIDAEGARILRWRGRVVTSRIRSDIPIHERSTDHVRHDPMVRHGGGGRGADDAARRRSEHLRRFLARVDAALRGDEVIDVLGTGPLGERLAARIRRTDHARHPGRIVTVERSAALTPRQLGARLRERVGVVPLRGGRGAYRWTGDLPRTRSGRVIGPRRVIAPRPSARDG